MIQELTIVKIRGDNSGINVPLSALGTVVMVHRHPRVAYEVEFVDSNGNTIENSLTGESTYTMTEDQLEVVE